jgi:hypothetical protein
LPYVPNCEQRVAPLTQLEIGPTARQTAVRLRIARGQLSTNGLVGRLLFRRRIDDAKAGGVDGTGRDAEKPMDARGEIRRTVDDVFELQYQELSARKTIEIPREQIGIQTARKVRIGTRES